MKRFFHRYFIKTIILLLSTVFIISCGVQSTSRNNNSNQSNQLLSDNQSADNTEDNETMTLTPTPYKEPTVIITSTSIPTPTTTPSITPSPTPIVELPDTASWTDETHKYVWFGSYPQTEIKGDELTEAIINASYDSNGVAIIGSNKYKRLSEEELPRLYYHDYEGNSGYMHNRDGYFDWTVNEYAYFIYEPIKWRVLSNENDELFLLSEYSIDTQPYNASQDDISWKTCTLRSWLNGFDESENMLGIDYSTQGTNFITTAFTEEEVTHISETENENIALFRPDEPNSVEKVFLLSSYDVVNNQYGFSENSSYNYDADKSGRVAYNTDYSMVMGGAIIKSDELYLRTSIWWLRSLGNPSEEEGISAVNISLYGNLSADIVNNPFVSFRPALYLTLKISGE